MDVDEYLQKIGEKKSKTYDWEVSANFQLVIYEVISEKDRREIARKQMRRVNGNVYQVDMINAGYTLNIDFFM